MSKRDVIFEMIPQGTFIRVIAVDVVTGREVMMMGSRVATREQLEQVAYAKLLYVLEKENLLQGEDTISYC